jgi:hypothetical protein
MARRAVLDQNRRDVPGKRDRGLRGRMRVRGRRPLAGRDGEGAAEDGGDAQANSDRGLYLGSLQRIKSGRLTARLDLVDNTYV